MQEKSEKNSEYAQRTSLLAAKMCLNLSDLPRKIGVSASMFHAYRSGQQPISRKAWEKLKALESQVMDDLMGTQEVARLPDHRKQLTLKMGRKRMEKRDDLGEHKIGEVMEAITERLEQCLHGTKKTTALYIEECHTRLDEFKRWADLLKEDPETHSLPLPSRENP